jgi:hypothetical protein
MQSQTLIGEKQKIQTTQMNEYYKFFDEMTQTNK